VSWTKAAVIVSALGALTVETVLVRGDMSELPALGLVAAAVAVAAARWRPDLAPGVTMAIGSLVPALFMIVHGHFRLWYLVPWKWALVGATAATIGRRWHYPPRFRFGFVAWALAVAAVWPIIALRELDWIPSLFWRGSSTPSSAVHAVAASVWIAQIAHVHLLALLWMDWLFGRFGSDGIERFEQTIVRPLFAAALAGALLAIYQGFVDLKFLSLGPWADLRRAGGALTDANASGALMALWVAMPLGMAATARSPRRAALLATASGLLLLAVWATGSRTALLGSIVGLSAIVHLWLVGSDRRLRAAIGSVAVVATVIVAVAAVRPSAVGPISRAQQLLPNLSPAAIGHAAWELLWARDGYGLVAVAMIRDEPLQGVGLGAFHGIGVEYGQRVTGYPLPPDNAQNWFRHQLAELGLLGSVGWIASAVVFAGVLFRGRAVAAARATTLRYSIAGFAVASMLGMPGQNLIVALTFSTFAFWLLIVSADDRSEDRPDAKVRSLGAGRFEVPVAVALAIAFAALTVYAGFRSLRPPFRAERFGLGYRYGWYVPFQGVSGRTRTSDHAVVVARAARRWLKLTLWVEHPDADARPVLAQAWIDHDRVVRRRLPRALPITQYVEIPDEKPYFVLETTADRTFLPPDRQYGEVGLEVVWEFVDRPPS